MLSTTAYAIPRIDWTTRTPATRKSLIGTRGTPARTRRKMPRMTGGTGEAGKLVIGMVFSTLDAPTGVYTLIDPIVRIGGARRAIATRPSFHKSNVRP